MTNFYRVAITVIAAGGGTLLLALITGIAIWYCLRRRKAQEARSAAPPRSRWNQLDSEQGFVRTNVTQIQEKASSEALNSFSRGLSGPGSLASRLRSASSRPRSEIKTEAETDMDTETGSEVVSQSRLLSQCGSDPRTPRPFDWSMGQAATDRRQMCQDSRPSGGGEGEGEEGYVRNPPHTAPSLEALTLSSGQSFGSLLDEMPRVLPHQQQLPLPSASGSRSREPERAVDDRVEFDGPASNPFDGDGALSDISSFAMSPNPTPALSKFPTRQSTILLGPTLSSTPPSAPQPQAKTQVQTSGKPPRPPRPPRGGSLADSLASAEIEHVLEMVKLYSPEGGAIPVPVPTRTPAFPSQETVSPTAGPPTPRSLNTLLTTPYTAQTLLPVLHSHPRPSFLPAHYQQTLPHPPPAHQTLSRHPSSLPIAARPSRGYRLRCCPQDSAPESRSRHHLSRPTPRSVCAGQLSSPSQVPSTAGSARRRSRHSNCS